MAQAYDVWQLIAYLRPDGDDYMPLDVPVIVVDSLIGPFRPQFRGRERPALGQTIGYLLDLLRRRAGGLGHLVVLTDQVMAVPEAFAALKRPAGGDTFLHAVNALFMMSRPSKQKAEGYIWPLDVPGMSPEVKMKYDMKSRRTASTRTKRSASGLVVENKKGRFLLRPDSPLNYRRVYVDVFSLAASLSDREELFRGLVELMDQAAMEGRALEVVLVLDAWSDAHLPLAREYVKLAEGYGLPYALSERKPAELYAVELCELCAPGCAVLTRDYDAVNAAVNCPVLVARAGRAYRARPVEEAPRDGYTKRRGPGPIWST